jgi:hypothetical protein
MAAMTFHDFFAVVTTPGLLGGVFTLGAAIINLRAAIINARKGAPPPPPPVPSESRPPRATGAPPTKAG